MSKFESTPFFIVIDPGLMEAGGHHAGFASFVVDSVKKGIAPPTAFFCHRELDKKLEAEMLATGVQVFKIFETNFYDGFNLDLRLSQLDDYLAELVAEYQQALQLVNTEFDADVIFYPCLAWHHAIALNTALTLSNLVQDKVRQIGCAMFNPGVGYQQEVWHYDLQRQSAYAFSWLNRQANFQLVASDYELSVAYQSLLSLDKKLPIHPCYLADWGMMEQLLKKEEKDPNRIILYMGDAKADKGFLHLPDLIKSNVKLNPQLTLVIHFTIGWLSPDIDPCIKEVDRLASLYPQIELHRQYWNQQEMLRQLAKANGIVFTYDPIAYKNKSSGVLWLAVKARLHIAALSESWITRESRRLGIEPHIWEDYDLSGTFLNQQQHSEDKIDHLCDYYITLFKEFWLWLNPTQNSSKLARQSAKSHQVGKSCLSI